MNLDDPRPRPPTSQPSSSIQSLQLQNYSRSRGIYGVSVGDDKGFNEDYEQWLHKQTSSGFRTKSDHK